MCIRIHIYCIEFLIIMVTFNSAMYPFTTEQAMTRQVKNTIGSLKPQDRNLEIKGMLIERKESHKIKGNLEFTQFVIADNTGSILCNYFGDLYIVTACPNCKVSISIICGRCLSALFKRNMILYTGKKLQFTELKASIQRIRNSHF